MGKAMGKATAATIEQELISILQRSDGALAKAGPGASADDHAPMLALLNDIEEFSTKLAVAVTALDVLKFAYKRVLERAQASEVIFGAECGYELDQRSGNFTTWSNALLKEMPVDFPHLGIVRGRELSDEDIPF